MRCPSYESAVSHAKANAARNTGPLAVPEPWGVYRDQSGQWCIEPTSTGPRARIVYLAFPPGDHADIELPQQ